MADAVTSRYIYPPNWEGHIAGDGAELGRDGHQGMGPHRYILHLTNISDGTGESKVNKFKLADHRTASGKVLLRTVIEWIEFDIFAMDVTLYWSRELDRVLVRLPGGASTASGKIRGPLIDPGTGDGTDGTGDILLSTTNSASGDSYDIRMCIRGKDTIRPGRNPEDFPQRPRIELEDGAPHFDSGLRR